LSPVDLLREKGVCARKSKKERESATTTGT